MQQGVGVVERNPDLVKLDCLRLLSSAVQAFRDLDQVAQG
jgi:hypothetical protein